MSTTTLPYRAFDADNHYYEAPDAFTRHLDKKMSSRAMQWAEIGGRQRLLVGGHVNKFIPNPLFDPVAKPGCLYLYFKGENPEHKDIRAAFGELEPIHAEYRDRDARLQVMDEQNLEATWLFPTLGVGMEQALVRDPEALVAAFHAFNLWLDEDWGLHYHDRIFSAPVHHARRRRRRRRGARVGDRARRPHREHARRHRCTPRKARSRPPTRCSTRSGRGPTKPASSSRHTPATAATAPSRTSGSRPATSWRSGPRRCARS